MKTRSDRISAVRKSTGAFPTGVIARVDCKCEKLVFCRMLPDRRQRTDETVIAPPHKPHKPCASGETLLIGESLTTPLCTRTNCVRSSITRSVFSLRRVAHDNRLHHSSLPPQFANCSRNCAARGVFYCSSSGVILISSWCASFAASGTCIEGALCVYRQTRDCRGHNPRPAS